MNPHGGSPPPDFKSRPQCRRDAEFVWRSGILGVAVSAGVAPVAKSVTDSVTCRASKRSEMGLRRVGTFSPPKKSRVRKRGRCNSRLDLQHGKSGQRAGGRSRIHGSAPVQWHAAHTNRLELASFRAVVGRIEASLTQRTDSEAAASLCMPGEAGLSPSRSTSRSRAAVFARRSLARGSAGFFVRGRGADSVTVARSAVEPPRADTGGDDRAEAADERQDS